LIDERNVMTTLFIVALSLAAAPAVSSGATDAGHRDHVLVAQLGAGDVTSPIGQTSANTTSGGMGGLDRSDTVGGSLNTAGAPASGATSTTGATSATGSTTTTSPSPSSSSGGLGNTGNTGLTGGTSGTGLGGTSTSTGLGSTTGGMR
jgi:hypothetical protein